MRCGGGGGFSVTVLGKIRYFDTFRSNTLEVHLDTVVMCPTQLLQSS